MDPSEKTREKRLRRMADRQGFFLTRSRRRDPRALGYGRFAIVDKFTGAPVYGELDTHNSLSMDDVEAWLTSDERSLK